VRTGGDLFGGWAVSRGARPLALRTGLAAGVPLSVVVRGEAATEGRRSSVDDTAGCVVAANWQDRWRLFPASRAMQMP
jgi:hypothetical protein